jgi:hypothetical protein
MKKKKINTVAIQNVLGDADNFVCVTSAGIVRTPWSAILNKIQVGGRNLWTNSHRTPTEITVTSSGASVPYRYLTDLGLKSGDKIIFSAYVSDIPAGESVLARIDFARPDDTYTQNLGTKEVSNEGSVFLSMTLPDLTGFDRIRYRIYPVGYKSNYNVKIMHEKLERGNIPTDWSPAWEDLQLKG